MLNENIKAIRKSKGLSQEDLALKLNVVRQTVSKWEQGRSVPDSDLLIALSEADAVKALAEKLEIINLQLARRKALRTAILHWLLITLYAGIGLGFAMLLAAGSPYLSWDFSDPELAVAGTIFHAFEWLFVRLAPLILLAAMVGIWLTRKKA